MPPRDGKSLQRTADGVEPFGADDGQREDARRHGQTLAEVDQSAHNFTVDPVLVDLDGDAERHAAENDHQVTHGQINEERVGNRAHVATSGEDTDDEDIADTAKKKCHAIQRYENRRRRLPVHKKFIPDSPQHFFGDPRSIRVSLL